jgi:hypothetical protein
LAVKSIWQYYVPERDVLGLLGVFRRMVNECLRIGIANSASSLRKLSLLSYNQLAQYDSPSYYKLCAISRQQEYWRLGRNLSEEAFLLGSRTLSDRSSSPATGSR